MVEAIGSMIGLYIITRMIETAIKNDNNWIRVFAIFTIAVAIFSLSYLWYLKVIGDQSSSGIKEVTNSESVLETIVDL